MAASQLEKSLERVFIKSAPKLPENGKKMLVEWLPWINLVIGVFTLLSVYWLWHWAHLANNLINYANSLSQALGTNTVVSHRLTVGLWLSLIILAVEAVIYLAAFPAVRARKKAGWDLLFYGLLINIVYGVVILFTNYGGFGTFLSSLIGSVIGLWLLFQIRDKYAASQGASPST